MLDIKFIRENPDPIKQNCAKRRVVVDIDRLLTVDEARRKSITAVEELRAARKQQSKGKPSPEDIARLKEVGERIKELEEAQVRVDAEYENLMLRIPNLTHDESPLGGEEEYRVLFTNREPASFSFPPKDHEALLLEKDLIDFDRATKVTGAKFYYTKGDMVRLNQALVNYGLDVLGKYGYSFMETPDLAKHEILKGAGFNPRGDEKQIYNIEETDLSLVGTAEITMLGYHAEEVLDLSRGPKKYAALSHCFRTEAGAYGRTSKGLYRVHQFTKLEMFIFCTPEESEALHQELLTIEKEICDGLDIPYRVIDIPTGDLGGPAYRKYDLEAWMTMKGDPSTATESAFGGYGEVTSTSNCTDYQARRLNIKYRKADGTTELVHTLNGTAIVTSRFPIAVVENNQEVDGSIRVPKVLQKYVGKEKI